MHMTMKNCEGRRKRAALFEIHFWKDNTVPFQKNMLDNVLLKIRYVSICSIALDCKVSYLYDFWMGLLHIVLYVPSSGASLLEKSTRVAPSSQLSLGKEKTWLKYTMIRFDLFSTHVNVTPPE